MSRREQSRKRQYRHRVICEACKKEIDSDYKDGHIKNVHKGVKVKFSKVVDANQLHLSQFFVRNETLPKRQKADVIITSECEPCSLVTKESSHSLGSRSPIASEVPDPTGSFTATEGVSEECKDQQGSTDDVTFFRPVSTFINLEDSTANVTSMISPNLVDSSNRETEISTKIISYEQSHQSPMSSIELDQVQGQANDIQTEIPTKFISDNQSHQSPRPSNVLDISKDISVNHCQLSESSTSEATCKASLVSCDMQRQANDIYESDDTHISLSAPNQPVLKTYARKTFGKDKGSRDFNPEWYKSYPWVSFQPEHSHFVCFACRQFMKDETFIFNNWKKSDKLKKHAKSNVHKNAMAKWIGSKINAKHKTSVIKQLTDAHQQDVQRNREYLRVIITSIFYNAQQNVAFRGHEENRDDIGKMSGKNRGNLLELLNLRCNDIPWLEDKLKSQLKLHAQWTSPSIQNEILEIISHFVVQRITKDVQLSRNYALIMDETSDISCTEQVSICLRHVLDGITLETFLGFFSTISTEGEVLFELVKKVMTDHGLELDDIVGECFDGASNMSGVRKGVAARMKECSPRGVYVHCYAHILNLALQDTMSDVEPLRNALGTLQSLYNFLEGSPKRHALFKSVEVDGDQLLLTLKSLSETRWSCRWEAVKAVTEQMRKIVRALLIFARDKDKKTYTDSRALMNAICDFEFVFGLILLKMILLNTNSLSKYLQGKSIDVITAKRNADLTIKTLQKCRDEKSFELLWKRAQILSRDIKGEIIGEDFVFKEARAPRNQPSRRLQALVGESTSVTNTKCVITPESHHRINTFYRSLDKVISEMKTRFSENDQEILCALGDVILNENPLQCNFEMVAEFYNIDKDLLEVEKDMYQNSIQASKSQAKTAADVVCKMFEDGLSDLLPILYEVATILASIPATSSSAERSFSGLRRVKTYLRSTMGQQRLNSIALINIERAYANQTIANDMIEIIDTFGERRGRYKYFF
jgi:hypothetical protein